MRPVLQKVHEGIGKFERYGVLITTISVVVAVISYCSLREARKQQAYSIAWTAISSAGNATVDGGRRQALTYLKDKGSLQGAPLANSLLSYEDLMAADLNRSSMENADLFGADLRDASIWGGRMKNANLQFAQLQGANLLYAELTCADLRGAHLERLLPRSKGSDSGNTILQQARLELAHLEGADLTGANLIKADLKNAHLEAYQDIFTGAECERDSKGLMEIVVKNAGSEPSAEEICEWASKHPTQDASIKLPKAFSCAGTPQKPATDLTEADLTGATLRGANLKGTNLTRAKLRDADLTGAEGTTADQINGALYVCNTTMPDGTKSYRDCPEYRQ